VFWYPNNICCFVNRDLLILHFTSPNLPARHQSPMPIPCFCWPLIQGTRKSDFINLCRLNLLFMWRESFVVSVLMAWVLCFCAVNCLSYQFFTACAPLNFVHCPPTHLLSIPSSFQILLANYVNMASLKSNWDLSKPCKVRDAQELNYCVRFLNSPLSYNTFMLKIDWGSTTNRTKNIRPEETE